MGPCHEDRDKTRAMKAVGGVWGWLWQQILIHSPQLYSTRSAARPRPLGVEISEGLGVGNVEAQGDDTSNSAKYAGSFTLA